MVLTLEGFAAHRAHVLPLVTVRQFVLRQGGRVPEHFPAHLHRQDHTL